MNVNNIYNIHFFIMLLPTLTLFRLQEIMFLSSLGRTSLCLFKFSKFRNNCTLFVLGRTKPNFLRSISDLKRQFNYRVSHETWQLVNGFESLLPYIILDIKDFFQFISLTNSFTQIYFPLKSIFFKMTAMLYFFLFCIKELNKLWKKTFKTIHKFMFRGTPCTI